MIARLRNLLSGGPAAAHPQATPTSPSSSTCSKTGPWSTDPTANAKK